MKHNWIYKKLKDICGIQYGYPFDSHCFTEDSSFPALIRIRDVVRGFSETYYKGSIPDEYYVKAGEYLIGMDGEFNIAPWRSEKALLNQRVCKIFSTDSETEVRFVYYSLIKILKQIEDETPSVTVKHLSAKRLNQIELPIPSLDEQQAIVRELDGINRLIDLQEEQLREYDRLAQSLFYTTFGDPATNPKGWEVKKLGDIADTYRGLTYSKKDEADISSKKVLRSNNIDLLTHSLDLEDVKCLREDFSIPDDKKLKKDSIFICMSNGSLQHLGKVAYIDRDYDYAFGGFMGLIIPSKSVSARFVFHTLLSPAFLHTILKEGRGANINNLKFSDIEKFPVPLPPLSLQQSFAAQIEAIEQQKALVRRSLDETRTLLAARMQYYFE